MSRGRRAAALLLAALFWLAGSLVEARPWPLIGWYGLWGSLGLGPELTYHRLGSERSVETSLVRLLNLSSAGYLYHPYLLTWDGNAGFGWGRELETRNAALNLGLLTMSSFPVYVTGQVAQDRVQQDFQPSRRAGIESVSAQAVLGATRDPLFLDWCTTETTSDDPQAPRHELARNLYARTNRRLNRDNDLSFNYEDAQVTEVLTGEPFGASNTALHLESRFLYDLLKLRSSLVKSEERRNHALATTRASEVLTVSHRPDWLTTLTLQAEENRRDGEPSTELSAGVETGLDLAYGWRTSLSTRLGETAGEGVQLVTLGTGARVGWTGQVGPVNTSAVANFLWQPQRGFGQYTRPAFETVATAASPFRLSNRLVLVDSIAVYQGLFQYEQGRDYELLLPSGAPDGVAETVFLLWRGSPNVKEVRVSYSYLIPAGDGETLVQDGTLTLATAADTLSLAVLARGSQRREYSEGQASRLDYDGGGSVRLTLVDGPFEVATVLESQEGMGYRRASLAYRLPRGTLAWTADRYETDGQTRRRNVLRGTYLVNRDGQLELKAFAQAAAGDGDGSPAERVVQAGVQAAARPRPNLSLSGSVAYLKDWANQEQDQVVATLKTSWVVGQLSVGLDSELEEDLGRRSARGKIGISLVRYF